MQPWRTLSNAAAPATRFCWPRPAPASTSSAASNTAGKSSNKSSSGWSRKANMSQRLKTDWILFGAVVAMVAFGLLMLYSASSVNAQMDPKFLNGWHFVLRQLGWAAASAIVMMTLKRTSYRKFQERAVAFGVIGVVLLLLLIVYFVDSAHHRGLRRIDEVDDQQQ